MASIFDINRITKDAFYGGYHPKRHRNFKYLNWIDKQRCVKEWSRLVKQESKRWKS